MEAAFVDTVSTINFNILVELEEQMFGEQKTYLHSYEKSYLGIDRKKKTTKSKIKRKPKKGCGCK
jgi:TfoX/Sxy family transcriptional regulator of competence genes